MSYTLDARATPPAYLITRQTGAAGYDLWQIEARAGGTLSHLASVASSALPASYRLIQSGGYIIAYDMSQMHTEAQTIAYKVLPLEIGAPDILGVAPLLEGTWERSKFWGGYNHYYWDMEAAPDFQLLPLTHYVMCYMPAPGRNTFRVWNFDPAPLDGEYGRDPLNVARSQMDALSGIDPTAALIPMDNYVLEWRAAAQDYRLWSFDPQAPRPIALPQITQSPCPQIAPDSQLVPAGGTLLEIRADGSYRLHGFDPLSPSPIGAVLSEGALPPGFGPDLALTPLSPRLDIDAGLAHQPGTMDFMRERVDHLVVYMLESRSFDSVLGWLYADTDPQDLKFINGDDSFDGLKPEYANEYNGKTYPVSLVQEGNLDANQVLAYPKIDPFHGTTDSINQQWSGGFAAYAAGAPADMGGFVANNASAEVMQMFTPVQLPVLNGLAASYGVSDAWFSALPGGTDSNRAVALTGSTFNLTMTYEGGADYTTFPDSLRRPSIWKLLWNEGITDWKIYWSVIWMDFVFTYHLYLRHQIDAVDANVDAGGTDYVAPIDQFFKDAKQGQLPRFSFLEPAWIAPNGATSYHPGASGDMVPGERRLREIYEALRASPNWERTALVITFSKGGGMYDHVPPSATINPWPKDLNDGFAFDVLGPRVPAILVSPLVAENTVFRAGSETPLSASSIGASVLDWMGLPRSRWGLGDRMPRAETFEAALTLSTPRSDHPALDLPYDKDFPPLPWQSLAVQTLSYDLGPEARISQLYPPADFANPGLGFKTLCDVIAHYTQSSLEADGLGQVRASAALVQGQYHITLTGQAEPETLGAFAARHAALFAQDAAGQAIQGRDLMQALGVWNPMAGYHASRNPNDGLCKWHLFPPLGLNMIGQKGILLMHYPPWQVIQDGTMTDCMTMARWTSVLEAAGFAQEEAARYRTFVDVNPIAAPGSGQSEYPNDYLPIMAASGVFDGPAAEGRDYIRSMLELYLNPPGHSGQEYTLPLLVCGSPLYDPQAPGWLKAAFKEAMPQDSNGIPQNNVLQAGYIRLRPDSPLKTPYLIANHMIAAGVTGGCTDDAGKIPDIRTYEAQDLVAASFLALYAANPDMDPMEAKAQACARWFGTPDGSGAPNPSKEEDKAAICALAQMDMYFEGAPEPHSKYTYAEALKRCASADNDPCAAAIGTRYKGGCGCGCKGEG